MQGTVRRGTQQLGTRRGVTIPVLARSDLWTVGADGQPMAPPSVAAAKEAVRGADAVAIFSPEYNYGVSAARGTTLRGH